MKGHHSIQRCLVVRQGKTVRNQWRKLQQADAKEPHRICPGSRRGAKDTIDCQVLDDEDIALQAQMSACPCDALEENRSPSSRQAHREFDPGGAERKKACATTAAGSKRAASWKEASRGSL
jgi:hypothetical protein